MNHHALVQRTRSRLPRRGREALPTLMEGKTTVVIAHRRSSVGRFHQVLVMDRRRIANEGGHEVFFLRAGFYTWICKERLQLEETPP